MAYKIFGQVSIGYVPDGAGPNFVPSMQVLTVAQGSGPFGQLGTGADTSILVPGGNAPTSGNITTAVGSFATAIEAQLETAANLATIQGWATGNQ